ncbi:hypothetical protein [Embleya sp. NPDC001921]
MAALGIGAADADLPRRVIGDAPVGIGLLDAELRRTPVSAADRTDDALPLVEDLAARAAVAIDKARRHTHAQGIAAELQRALLTEPGTPHPNLELAFRYLPSGTTSVGATGTRSCGCPSGAPSWSWATSWDTASKPPST